MLGKFIFIVWQGRGPIFLTNAFVKKQSPQNSVIYLDDVLVGSKTWEDHVLQFGIQFLPLTALQFKTEPEKVHFRRTRDWISRIHNFCMQGASNREKKRRKQWRNSLPLNQWKKSDNLQDSPINLEPSSLRMQSWQENWQNSLQKRPAGEEGICHPMP